MSQTELLSFGVGNAKLGKNIHTFSLPAGHTCPGAFACMAKADRKTGKITDGPDQQFRCFAASAEAIYPSTRNSRWRNLELLRKARTRGAMAELINASLPENATIVRVHVSGDFYNEEYFMAWMAVGHARPHVKFYAYTKSLPLWKKLIEWVPDNFVLTASLGGKFDNYAVGLKTARVVFSEEEAAALAIEIDHDDTHAYEGKDDFALLLHGSQPKGSKASAHLQKLRAAGKGGYSRKKK